MNTLYLVICLISALSTAFVSCFHAWLDYKKQKEKNEAWDAAVKLFGRADTFMNPIDDFAELYAALSFIHDHPNVDYKNQPLDSLMREASESDKQ